MVVMVAHDYPVSQICEVFDYPRSSYFHRARVADEEALGQAIEAEAAQWLTYGYRRITHQLRRQGWTVNHKRVERIMHERGLQARRKRKHHQTTDSAHPFPRYPNLVEHLEIVHPDHVYWATRGVCVLGRDDGRLHAWHSRLAPGV